MKLRGIEFGDVFCASGARNFFGEGWSYHAPFKPFGLNYEGSTLITKTTTIDPRPGNMPLRKGSTQPVERIPKCIVVKPIAGVTLNSVGLSGPGLNWLLEQNIWQKINEPFIISFMAVGKNHDDEYRRFVETLLPALRFFKAPVAIETNLSCPNANVHFDDIVAEAYGYLNILIDLDVPIIIKVNILLDPGAVCKIAAHKSCDAIDVSNTIPYGQLPNQIPWDKYFGNKGSPLAHLGGGGLSGKPLLPIVAKWIKELKEKTSYHTRIIGGGGILSCSDADIMLDSGADAISLGCVSMLRPWRVQKIIRYVIEHKGYEDKYTQAEFLKQQQELEGDK